MRRRNHHNDMFETGLIGLVAVGIIALMVWGITYELDRNHGTPTKVTFTIKDKKRDIWGGNKDEPAFVVKTEDGDTFQVANNPMQPAFDWAGRPKAYRTMNTGETWRCESRGKEKPKLHKWRKIRNCIKVEQ